MERKIPLHRIYYFFRNFIFTYYIEIRNVTTIFTEVYEVEMSGENHPKYFILMSISFSSFFSWLRILTLNRSCHKGNRPVWSDLFLWEFLFLENPDPPRWSYLRVLKIEYLNNNLFIYIMALLQLAFGFNWLSFYYEKYMLFLLSYQDPPSVLSWLLSRTYWLDCTREIYFHELQNLIIINFNVVQVKKQTCVIIILIFCRLKVS